MITEFEAISEYANQCDETVSNVLRKAVFEWAALTQEGCPEGYSLNRYVPEGMDDDASLSKDVNKIRQILGWDKIDLFGAHGSRIGKPLTDGEKVCADAFRVEPGMTSRQQTYKNLDDLFAGKRIHVPGIIVGKEKRK